MIKFWRFLSISIVAAVCLGLMLVPGVPLSNNVALAANNVTIEVLPASQFVLPGDPFNVEVWIQNPDAMDIYGCQARLDFDNTYFNITGLTGSPLFTFVLSPAPGYDNTNGTIDYDCAMPTPPGDPTNATSIKIANISCVALAKEGMSTIDFVYQVSPPRKTMVTLGMTDYLETGNMSLMHSGTVTIGTPELTVDVSPAGKGDVNISGVIPSFYPNVTVWNWSDVVDLKAVENVAGWTFHHWSGNLTGNTTPDTVTMDSDKSVVAHFARYNLTVSSTSGGTVTDPGEGTFRYAEGDIVPLQATSDTGYHFVNWTEDVGMIVDANAANTTINMSGDYFITANFAINRYNLTINSTAGGNTTPGEGVHGPYNHGAVVNLTATPDTGYAFVGWSGDNGTIADVNSSATNITMYGNYSITAHFGPHDFSVLPISLTFTTVEGENPPSQTLKICNTGDGILNWSLEDNAAWLSESPMSGSLEEDECEDVTVSVDVAGMAAGDYSATITFTGSLELEIPVSLRIESAMPDMLVGPAQLSASALSISPQQVQPGQDVTISINVANTGGETGSYNAVLYINGVVEDSQSVSVAAGASKNVIFTVTKSKAGVYDVSVAGQNGQFEVVSTGWFAGGLGTGGIIAIVVIVIVLIVAVVFILRGTTRPE